jgi:hypothetical protein
MPPVTRTALLALAALGCATSHPGVVTTELPPPAATGTVDDRVTDRVVQDVPEAVDVLFVIDDSCSMAPFQQALDAAFPTFMGRLEGADIDVQVVTTTVDLGADSGLGSIYVALAELGETDGLYRPDATLHTIVVTDEDDQTEVDSPPVITIDEFVNWYDALKASPEERSFSSVVPTALSVGDRYVQITDEIGGVVGDLHDDDVDGLLDELGLLAAGLDKEFHLSALPEPGTIEVKVVQPDGGVSTKVEGEADADGDWVYDEVGNAIVFHTFVAEPLDTVEISYVPLGATSTSSP